MNTIGGVKMQYYINSCLKLQAELEGLANQYPCEYSNVLSWTMNVWQLSFVNSLILSTYSIKDIKYFNYLYKQLVKSHISTTAAHCQSSLIFLRKIKYPKISPKPIFFSRTNIFGAFVVAGEEISWVEFPLLIHFFAVLDSEATLTPWVEVVDQVVEHTPRNIKVVGLNPAWCSSLSSSFFLLQFYFIKSDPSKRCISTCNVQSFQIRKP